MDDECVMFRRVFSVLSKDSFLSNPWFIMSYMRDAGFSKPYMSLLETIIDIDQRQFIASLTCPDVEIDNHVKIISEDCFLNEDVLLQIVLAIRSSFKPQSSTTDVNHHSDENLVESNAVDVVKKKTSQAREPNSGNDAQHRLNNELLLMFNRVRSHSSSTIENNRTKSIIIPESVTAIGDYKYKGYSSIEEIHIPESVISIGRGAFSGCTSLKIIHIPNSVKTIGDSAFSGCTSLKEVHIPNSVKTIGDSAFYGCKSLEVINIPNSVTEIKKYTFGCCESLRKVHIPNSVKTIGDYAFSYCKSLKTVYIPESVVTIGNCAFNCTRTLRDTLNNWNF